MLRANNQDRESYAAWDDAGNLFLAAQSYCSYEPHARPRTIVLMILRRRLECVRMPATDVRPLALKLVLDALWVISAIYISLNLPFAQGAAHSRTDRQSDRNAKKREDVNKKWANLDISMNRHTGIVRSDGCMNTG